MTRSAIYERSRRVVKTIGGVCALVGVMLFPTGCVEQPIAVTVTLRAEGDADFSNVDCLKVIVRTSDPMPSVFGPFERTADVQTRLGATVAPGERFTVDVQGCPSFNSGGDLCPEQACTPETILVDGCWGPDSIDNDGEAITIFVGETDVTPECQAPE